MCVRESQRERVCVYSPAYGLNSDIKLPNTTPCCCCCCAARPNRTTSRHAPAIAAESTSILYRRMPPRLLPLPSTEGLVPFTSPSSIAASIASVRVRVRVCKCKLHQPCVKCCETLDLSRTSSRMMLVKSSLERAPMVLL
jgi:hypothetical protein